MLSVDIETIPNEEMIFLLPEIKPDSRLKDEEKIAADIEKKKAEQFQKMALDPLYGKIACICVYGNNGQVEKTFMLNSDETGEKELLEEFLKFTKKKMVVTWNGKGFDYDFIYKRAIIHDLATLRDRKFYVDKYKSTYHTDLMEEFCHFGKYEKLNTVCKVILGKEKIDFDVTKIRDLLKTEEGRKQLQEYCMQDTKLTYELAVKFGYSDNYDVIGYER